MNETNTLPVDNLGSLPNPGPAGPVAPAVAPIAPLPAPAPAAPSTPPLSSMSGGGGGKFDVIKDINWVETFLLGAAMGALMYVIAYYRYKLKEDKLINSDTQRQIDKMNQRVGNLETQYSKLTTPAPATA